jgi:hypothetical protein
LDFVFIGIFLLLNSEDEGKPHARVLQYSLGPISNQANLRLAEDAPLYRRRDPCLLVAASPLKYSSFLP